MKRRVSTAKRIVAVALAATVAVSLTGCKKRKNTNDTTSSDVTTSQSQAAVPETPEVTATPAPTATPEPTAAPAENTDKKDNATSEPTKTNKPSSGASTSGGTTKPAATKTPAPAPAATPAPTAKPQVKYTFTVRRHEATCTTQGYDEHICHEWGGMNYNDRFVPAKGHSWDGGTVTKAATYTETGIKPSSARNAMRRAPRKSRLSTRPIISRALLLRPAPLRVIPSMSAMKSPVLPIRAITRQSCRTPTMPVRSQSLLPSMRRVSRPLPAPPAALHTRKIFRWSRRPGIRAIR